MDEEHREPESPRQALVEQPRRWALVFAACSFIVAVGCSLAALHARENTFLQHPEWMIYKKRLGTELMGVPSYMMGTQAFAGNRLNLDAWHGYQEVLYRDKTVPSEISCRVFLGEDAYCALVFDKDFDGFRGIRVSSSKRHPGAFLTADISGRFLEKEENATLTVAGNACYRLKAVFDGQRVSVSLDGAAAGQFSYQAGAAKWIGFRGGAHRVWVDDVFIRSAGTGKVFRDNFRYLGLTAWGYIKFLVFGALISCLIIGVLFGLRRGRGEVLGVLSSVYLCVAAGALVYTVFTTHVLNGRYPVVSKVIERKEDAYVSKAILTINDELQKTHTLSKPPGVQRILFLGTSQTHGHGAQEPEDCFVRRIETELNVEAGPSGRFECIKGAIPGATSNELYQAYKEYWIQFSPDLVVVNLSCNDDDAKSFESNLRGIAELNREGSIKTLFVLEALSGEEFPDGDSMHPVMRRVAEEYGIRVLDAHQEIMRHDDEGFIFWDVVHMTSFGHELMTQFLLPEIEGCFSRRPDPPHSPA